MHLFLLLQHLHGRRGTSRRLFSSILRAPHKTAEAVGSIYTGTGKREGTPQRGTFELTADNKENNAADDAKNVPCFTPCCDFSFGDADVWWTGESLPLYSTAPVQEPANNDIALRIDSTIQSLSHQLRDLSLKIHGSRFFLSADRLLTLNALGHPELMFKERCVLFS